MMSSSRFLGSSVPAISRLAGEILVASCRAADIQRSRVRTSLLCGGVEAFLRGWVGNVWRGGNICCKIQGGPLAVRNGVK